MLVTLIENANYIAGDVLARLVNAALPAALAIGVTIVLARHRAWNAASRYWAWWLLLALVVAAPLVPPSEVVPAPGLSQVAASPIPLEARIGALPAELTSPDAIVSRRGAWTGGGVSPSLVFLLCWIAAACLQLFRVGQGLLRSWELKRRSYAAPAHLESQFRSLSERAGMRRPVSLAVSDDLDSPAVLGYRKPQILLPGALLAHLDGTEVEQILLHELAHVERRDDCLILLQRTIEAAGVFHPLIAYLAHRMNLDREIACDDRVAEICGAREYAACLTRVAEIRQFGSASPMTVPLLLERKPELLVRVESLLDRTRAHRPGVSMVQLSVVLGCVATAAVAAAFSPRLMASPAMVVEQISLTSTLDWQSPAPPAEESAPEPPAAPSAPGHLTSSRSTSSPSTSSRGISSLSITSEGGSTSNWGSWSGGEEKGEPGTITFTSSGKHYIIRDHATVSEAVKLVQPMEELGKRQSELGKKQEELGKQQEALGAKQEALANEPLDSATLNHLRQQLAELETRLHQIDLEKEMKTAQGAMEKLGALQEQIGKIQDHMGASQGLRGEKQGELGEEQGKLGEMQGRLGEMQGKLGEEQARAAEHARRLLEDLVRRAQQKGLAQPLP